MGMFDFVKSVGKKLGFGGDDEAAPKADSAEEGTRFAQARHR